MSAIMAHLDPGADSASTAPRAPATTRLYPPRLRPNLVERSSLITRLGDDPDRHHHPGHDRDRPDPLLPSPARAGRRPARGGAPPRPARLWPRHRLRDRDQRGRLSGPGALQLSAAAAVPIADPAAWVDVIANPEFFPTPETYKSYGKDYLLLDRQINVSAQSIGPRRLPGGRRVDMSSPPGLEPLSGHGPTRLQPLAT